MYCSNCGSDMVETSCPGCGRTLPISARGKIDEQTGLMLGGWWRRVGATVSDNLILLLPALLVVSLFSELDGPIAGFLAGLAVESAYVIKLLTGPNGQTIGNRVAATRVRDAHSGGRITTTQAWKRWGFIAVTYTAIDMATVPVLFVLFMVILLADILYPLIDTRNQTLHDKFAGTLLVIA